MKNEADIVPYDVDEATYVGDGADGCYYQTGKGVDGWYVTVVVDSETGSFVDTLRKDEGPFPSDEEAASAGRGIAVEWCIDNAVKFEDDVCSSDS